MSKKIAVQGTVAEGFEGVREEFAAVLAEERPGHADAQLAVFAGGRQVVDLWGGDEITGTTLTSVFSSTKGAAHLVVALLVQEGVLDLDREVAHYWPEFAAEGKGALTLRDLLAHRAGVVGADTGFTDEELTDDRVIAERLAAQKPYWRPGTAFGYHALSIGALTGEVVRRATGQSIQEVFEERVRAPYDLDFYLGLPEELESRVLDILPMDPTPEQQAELVAGAVSPQSVTGIAFNLNGERPTDLVAFVNSRPTRAKSPASVGGVATATGLAKMYAVAIGEVDGRAALLKPDTIAEFGQIHSDGYDLVARRRHPFGLGFESYGDLYPALGAGAFGHAGAAGSEALADPRSGVTYGYARRRFAFPGGPAPENVRLVGAVMRAVGEVGAG
ncbi:serine hydrolase [Streptomyces sp. ISL-100]|uniref:serine hydrolase domain-containing protein n=1 Tax=Streptomyces sp. ISL-100 TaxID=2819173 RepID=UPI001BE7BD70|nr:serine hydrolase domain-containing protein [Streptomyces sp. ISL-100]MBT2398788.1 beta-lactamase family protein [Streptomyces sp. ISL-100]